MALESQISTVGVEQNASLRQKLDELATVVDRLDARHTWRQQRAAAMEEAGAMGIYESCVSVLPNFSQGEAIDCPACARRAAPVVQHEATQLVPPWIRAEVDWRRQHTEVLNQRIEVLEREKSLWEQKLRNLQGSPGTSSRNKIFQLFPKDPPAEPDVEVEDLPGTVHAWSVGPSALKASARQVYEKMLHPQPLQSIHPPPKRERERLQEERAMQAERKAEEELKAQEERLQQELSLSVANRQELRSALQRELHSMRCLEAERQRQRDALRATLQDELHGHLQQERRAWQVEQERQHLERQAAERQRAEVHKEMQRVELERLLDKLSLQRRLRPAPAASFKEDTLVELLKLRLAKDPERSELKIEELEEMEMEAELPTDLGIEEWLLFYGDLLNGTSRDKVADIDALEQAFLVISCNKNCLDTSCLHERMGSLSTPGVVKPMLLYWLQHCASQHAKATKQQLHIDLHSGNPVHPGESESIESGSPLETATPCQEDGAMENGLDGKTPENTVRVEDIWESPSHKAGAQGSTRPSQASVPGEESRQAAPTLTKNLRPNDLSHSETTANETGHQMQHTRTSLASKAPVERHDDDVWESPSHKAGAQGSTRPSQASVLGEESKQAASTLTKNLYARYAARSEKAADETGYQLQHTRTSLASKAPVERHDDDVWEPPSQRAQGAQGSTRPSQASVPGEESKQAASTLTKNLYAKYAARSEATEDETGYQLQQTRMSLASKAPVEWDDDDGWEPPSQKAQGAQGSTRPSQASVPGEESKQAASSLEPGATVGDAAFQRTSVASKSPPGDAEVDEAASEDEVFTKEQWVEWFKTAELEEAEVALLTTALDTLENEQQLSPEEMAEALRSYDQGSQEELDQLQEWAQWALEIND